MMRTMVEMALASADEAGRRGDSDWQRFWMAWALLLVTVAQEWS